MDAGIVSYGAYVPRYRILPETIGNVWGADGKGMGKGLYINQKSVPSPDEDVVTIATEAARNAATTSEAIRTAFTRREPWTVSSTRSTRTPGSSSRTFSRGS